MRFNVTISTFLLMVRIKQNSRIRNTKGQAKAKGLNESGLEKRYP